MAGVSRTAARAACALALTAWLLPVATARGATVPGGRLTGLSAVASTGSRVPPAARVPVTVALKPRDPAVLAAYAQAVSTPGSADYHHYLTPSQFGRRFGPTAAAIAVVRRSLRARGLHPGKVGAGGLSIPLLATAGQLERGFQTSLRRLSYSGRRTAIAASSPLALDAKAAEIVQSVVGLDASPAPRPLLARPALRFGRSSEQPQVATGGPQPCASAQGAAPSQSAYTADQIASAYGFSGLYAAGDRGAGVTVAVYELEPDDPADIAAYQSCYGTHAAVSYDHVDGGAGTGAGSGEAAIDIENTVGLDPDANVLVYQGPNSNSNGPGSGPFDIFRAIVQQDRAQVVSVSWGDCEADLGQANAIAENTLFEQAAIQGQTIVSAGGDSGSEDCSGGGTLPENQLAVDDPASQPFVTGVGGTTLSALGPRPGESVWNDGGSLAGGLVEPGAGGGGVSEFWSMAPAQLDAAASLAVRNPAARCASSSGYCREVPDVSADADPNTGYLIYWNGSGSASGQPTGWQGFGGTSAAAPVWAALLALADASPACAGSPVGYADPALYRAAGHAYAGDFNDVTTGNNDFTGTNGGQFAAAAGYDRASGLGTPNGATLDAALCADTVRLRSPGNQRSAIHSTVSLRLSGRDAPSQKLGYQVKGLPPGLKLGTASGKITGKPRRTGVFTVKVAVVDAEGSASTRAFTWTIGAAPRLSRARLATGPKLTFTVGAGRRAPALSTLRVTAPRGLRLVSRHGLSVTTTAVKGRRLRFTAHVAHGAVTIKLRRVAASLRVTLARPGLADAGGRSAEISRRGRAATRLSVTILDASAGTSRLSTTLLAARR